MRYDNILLLTDLDGTFLNSESKPVVKNIEAVNRFVENGGLFSVASGRPPRSAYKSISECRVNFPAVLFNGAMLYDFEKNEVLETLTPSKQIEQIVFDVYRQNKDRVGFLAYYENGLITPEKNSYSTRWAPYESVPFSAVGSIDEMPFPAVKYLYISDDETINRLYGDFVRDYGDILRVTSAGHGFLEVLAPGADKGSALMRLLKLRRKEVKTVVAIGDYLNDICILEKADIKAVVKGAPAEMLKMADFVTSKDNNEGAVADLIENLEDIIVGKA